MNQRDALVNYYMDNILENPELIRDALTEYFENTEDREVADLYNDLVGE